MFRSPALVNLLPTLVASCLVLAGLGSLPAAEPVTSAHWTAFKDATDRSGETVLTDYSYAGYARGEKAIPDVAGPVFSVSDFGAVPDDGVSDEAAIRQAVAAAEEAGGGVVLFPPGRFLVWTDRTKVEPIRIGTSGVVIRGAGSSAGGTIIQAIHSGYGTGPYPVPKKGADFAAIPYIFIFHKGAVSAGDDESEQGTAAPEAPTAAAPASVPVTGEAKRSTFRLAVASADGWKAGDWVSLTGRTTKLNAQLLGGLTPDPTWTRLLEGAGIAEIHQIREVDGNTLVFHEPLLLNLSAGDGLAAIRAPMIEQVGVEDIAFQGGWQAVFFHHRSVLDDEGWDAIHFDGVANGWVRRCAFLNINTGVLMIKSALCSVLQNRFAGARGHYNAASRNEGSFNLMGLMQDDAGALHSCSTGNRSAGITIWRWKILPTQSVDSHGNGPYATLIDRVDGGTMTKSGGPGPSFPNHMVGMVFWNFLYQGEDEMPINLWEMQKNGIAKFVKPLFTGIHGKPVSFQEGTLMDNESPGSPVVPESLYEAQLALRLGSLPAWVEASRAEWEKIRASELPAFGGKESIHEEDFPLTDLLQDFQGLMTKQEQGWAVPIQIQGDNTGVNLRRDYVSLRTLLHQMATYANEVPKKDSASGTYPEAGPMDVAVTVGEKEITITMPVKSSPKSQSKNEACLAIARKLAADCRGTIEAAPDSLRLTLQR
jgi:hypothetical protein